MKISLFTQNGALNSAPVFEAMEQGARKVGLDVVKNDINADILVIWSVLWQGRMKNNQEIWNFAKKLKKPLIIAEVGGLQRGTTWRIGLEHVNNLGKFGKNETLDIGRPEKLGIFLENREKLGENILICGQHSKSQQWNDRPTPELWLTSLYNELRKYSARKIVFRPHPRDYDWAYSLSKLDMEIHFPKKIEGTYDDFDLNRDLDNAWAVISPSSNPGIQAAIKGIPVFTDFDSLAYEVANKNIENIENPIIYDRKQWLVKISHIEYLLDEIKEGTPFVRLLKKLDF